jgi:dihydrodipicolinate synthase/N-acetylneuraminate lyase
MNIEQVLGQIRPRRKITGIAAALLPFAENGTIAVEAFQQHLLRTHSAGLINAVNMDTGYVNYLSEQEQEQILHWTREALPQNTKFVAGAYIEGLDGDVVSVYRRKIDQIIEYGGTPIIFQTARLHGRSGREKIRTYTEICRGFGEVLGFELASVFAANGETFDDETIRGLMQIPELKGLKHSSLDRMKELERLALRDEVRPEFTIYTGNDLAIDMIEYGSDYLLGLATFAPEKFAERDALWAAGDPDYYALSDALQHLGNVAFRAPVPAYKHSAAIFLHLTGELPSAKPHPQNPTRPTWEAELMRECAQRLQVV